MLAELRKALRETVQAAQLAEYAHMRLFTICQTLRLPKGQEITPEGIKALERLDRAFDVLGNAREDLGDTHYQVEQVLKDSGEET
jgi:hypothetical protein